VTHPDRSADLLLVGGRIRTLDAQRPKADAVAVAGGRVVAVGDEWDVLALRGRTTRVVDLGGATVLPGLVDSHLHPTFGLDLAAGLDLSGCTTLSAVRDALAAAATGADEWVRAWGLDPNVFGDRPVDAAAVEDVLGGRPALLRLFDGHGAIASTEALRRAGVDGARRFASTSTVVVDDDGVPTGLLLEEEAMALVDRVIPVEAFGERVERLAGVLRDMAATGLTGGHAMDCNGDTLELLTALDEAGRLPLRLRLHPWCRPGDATGGVPGLVALQGRGGRLWQVDGVKLFMDGTIDGGTAWLHEPDCHGESTRAYWLEPAEYRAAVAQLHAAGVGTATHAIGDAAVRYVLDAIEGLPATGVRHRVEHIETLPDDDVARFGRLGVVASMQPTHATDYTRADHSDNWSRRLGTERANRAWRCADILAGGAVLTLGSDWPIAPFDPRVVLAAAQLRRPPARPDLGPLNPGQALTAEQALEGYTRGPAWAARLEHEAGAVRDGFRADLTVLAADPVEVSAEELPSVPVTHTVVGGDLYVW
jgi:predicted amidohydrolase YtcJ